MNAADSDAALADWRRLSPLMLLVHPVRELVRYIPVLLAAFLAGGHGATGHSWSLAALVLVIVGSIVRWATTRFRITGDQVQLRTGLLRKRTVATPIDRVRTVDVTAHALHRVLGLGRVAIGTGTYDRKKEALVLDGLPIAQARALRAELLHRSPTTSEQWSVGAGGPAGLDGPSAPRPVVPGGPAGLDGLSAPPQAFPPWATARPSERELARFDPSWLRYAPFTLSGLVTGLAVLGFTWNLFAQSHVDAHRIGAVHSASHYLAHTAPWLVAVQLAIGGLVAVSLLSVVGYLLAFFGFRLTEHPGGTLQVSRGLLTTRATSIERTRLRGVELSETLLLRLVRGARLGAVTTGLRVGRGAERGGTVLVPPAPRRVVVEIGGRVLDEDGAQAALTLPLRAHGPRALRRRLLRACVPWLVLAAVSGLLSLITTWSLWWAALGLALALVSLTLGVDRYRSLGHAVIGRYLSASSGSLPRRRVALESEGIIGWTVRRTVFQRRAGLATLTATTAAGRHGYRVIDVDANAVPALIDAVTPGLLGPLGIPGPVEALER